MDRPTLVDEPGEAEQLAALARLVTTWLRVRGLPPGARPAGARPAPVDEEAPAR